MSRRVDRGNPVELSEDSVLRCPEANAARHRAVECDFRVGIDDELAQLAERRVLGERLADRVDQVQARAEVLVERRARDAGAVGHLLHRRPVEGPISEQVSDGRLDPRAGRLGLP